MNKILNKYFTITKKLEAGSDMILLLLRIVLAYGFYTTAVMKWKNISGVADWFASLGILAPSLNAYLAAATETIGVILLTVGLATRIISIPLIIVMIVAIKTVHWVNGFEAGNNGFEIPLYYMLMLLVLLIKGSGKLSADYFIKLRFGSRS
jgi:putative oxidoreductase